MQQNSISISVAITELQAPCILLCLAILSATWLKWGGVDFARFLALTLCCHSLLNEANR